MRNKTLRYILFFLSFAVATVSHAQLYRIFYHHPVNNQNEKEYVRLCSDAIAAEVDSVWMSSNWLHYSLVESKEYPQSLFHFSFVQSIEQVIPLQSASLQVSHKDSVDPAIIDKHRQWQLDTMGYQFFSKNNLTGKGVVIAIIDAGFTGANDSRAFKTIFDERRVLHTWDFIDNDTTVFDGSTHGTNVWSCIAGNLDGKQTGLATGASFILLRSEDQKTETMADEDRWILAIERAYELGADVVNSSIGFTNQLHKKSEVNGQSLISKAAQLATEKGMVVVMSAGNEWQTIWKTISIPADAEGVITVGGIDKQGKQSYFSSVGPTFDGRSKPDVVAPGTCVVVKGNSLIIANGTSFASPMVAGYMACMMEQKGYFNRDSIKIYSGLYPYFDYVFGYGVPGTKSYFAEYRGDAPCNGFEVDKMQSTVKRIIYCGNVPVLKHVYIKIEDADGMIKFSKMVNIPASGIFKVPVASKTSKFYYGKNYSPKSTDKWTIRFSDYFTVEY